MIADSVNSDFESSNKLMHCLSNGMGLWTEWVGVDGPLAVDGQGGYKWYQSWLTISVLIRYVLRPIVVRNKDISFCEWGEL